MFTIENTVKDVTLSQIGWDSHEDGLVDDRQRSIRQRLPQVVWRNPLWEPSDGSVRLRGADGRTLQDYGKRQIWLRIGNHLKRHEFHVVDVTQPILSVSYLCENGIVTHLARQPFLKHGERHEPLIKKSGVYFVQAQVVHEVKGVVEAVMHDKSQQISCVRAEGSQKSCVRSGGLQNSCVRAEGLHNSQNSCMWVEVFFLQKYQESCVEVEKQSSSKLNNAVVQPVVEDPVEDDRISAEAGAGMMPAPCEPSEIEKTKHDLTHIPFQPWCTSCVKGKAPG